MNFSRDYVGYLGRRTIKHLIDVKMIQTDKVEVLNGRVQAALIDELMLEDRINDEVRLILEAYQEEMRRTGASYQEMFKKIKQELEPFPDPAPLAWAGLEPCLGITGDR